MSFSTPVFRPDLFSDRVQTKKFLKFYLEFAYFSFLDSSFSFGFETITTFIHSRIACVASVSVRFLIEAKNDEQETKTARKIAK